MKEFIIKGKEYTPLIEGDSVRFEGVESDLYFEYGYLEMLEAAIEANEFRYRMNGASIYDHASYEVTQNPEHYLDWLLFNVEPTIINHNLN